MAGPIVGPWHRQNLLLFYIRVDSSSRGNLSRRGSKFVTGSDSKAMRKASTIQKIRGEQAFVSTR